MNIIEADITNEEHYNAAVALVSEYFEYGNALSIEAAGISFNTEEMLADMKQTLSKFAAKERGLLALMERDGEYIGVGAYRKSCDGSAELKRIYLKPQFRGNGWGRALVLFLIDHARKQGFKKVKLESGRYMREARALYESLGFYDVDPYDGSECGHQGLDVLYYMEKAL